MSMSDNIADMLSRIRNAYKVNMVSVLVTYSKINCAILSIMQSEGYIKDYQPDEGSLKIHVNLKYLPNATSAMLRIDRVSIPSKRCYSSASDLKHFFNGMGTLILSTSKGVISSKMAKKMNVGGEIICQIF